MTSTTAPPAVAPAAGAGAAGGRFPWTVVLLTSLGIVGYVVATYAQAGLPLDGSRGGLAATYAKRPLGIQLAFYVHIVAASVALLAGPFQFSSALRRRSRALHRWTGRVYLAGVGLGAPAAFVMSFVSSIAFDGFFGFGGLALLWAGTTWRAYRAVRGGDLANHRAWMIRSFALTYAAVTLRAWLGILILLQTITADGPVDGAHVFDTAYAVLPFLAWLPNLVVAEFLIRRRGLPSYRITPA